MLPPHVRVHPARSPRAILPVKRQCSCRGQSNCTMPTHLLLCARCMQVRLRAPCSAMLEWDRIASHMIHPARFLFHERACDPAAEPDTETRTRRSVAASLMPATSGPQRAAGTGNGMASQLPWLNESIQLRSMVPMVLVVITLNLLCLGMVITRTGMDAKPAPQKRNMMRWATSETKADRPSRSTRQRSACETEAGPDLEAPRSTRRACQPRSSSFIRGACAPLHIDVQLTVVIGLQQTDHILHSMLLQYR